MATEIPPAPPVRHHLVLAVVVAVLLFGQFITKPVHIDDTNFLRLAQGAAQDFRRPHLIPINWLGKTVPAFEVLSNPPGIAWWLVPVLNAPNWVRHLWMYLWLIPTAWGARELGRYFCGDDGWACAAVLLTSPCVVLSAHSFFPDLPLLACTVAGLGGFASGRRPREFWALVAGSAFLFRYSGCLVILPLLVIAWRQSGWKGLIRCWPAFVPMAALALNDFLVYGKWHLLAMFAFQNDSAHKSPELAAHNLIAGIAMLGGACLLPVLVWQRGVGIAAILGAWVGGNAAYLSQQTISQGVPTVIFTAAGFAAMFLVLGSKSREMSLSTWASLGLVLLVTSRFAAVRYWIPFVPAFVLMGLKCRSDRRSVEVAIALNLIVALGLAIDDYEFADCERQAALHIAGMSSTGQFSGHWGWQYYLEQQGWVALEPGDLPSGYLAVSEAADPQRPEQSACLRPVAYFHLPDRWPGPRIHSNAARAGYHAGGKGNYAPWTLTNEPYDLITLLHACPDAAVTSVPTPSPRD